MGSTPSNRQRVVSVLSMLGLLALQASAQERRVQVSGAVRGASGQHTIHVVLWDQRGFLRTAELESFFSPARSVRYALAVPVGQWAIAAYEDRNENGELDIGRSGAKEPLGFWPSVRLRRRPRFADVALRVERDFVDADITLR